MRKTLVFTLLLALLSAGSIGYVAADIYPLRNQVVIKEIAEDSYNGYGFFGDVSVTEGLTATLKTDYYKAMNWDTKIHFGTSLPETETDYTLTFPVKKSTRYLRERNEIDIRITIEDVVDNSVFEYLTDGLQPGQSRKEKVYLKDYADYYNTEVDILFPEVTYAWRPGDNTLDNETEEALKVLFDENFRFPLDEKVNVDAHADHGQYGPGYGYSINTTSDTFGLNVKETFLKDCVYFTFNRKGDNYRNLDISHLPLGYGIYCLTVPEDGSQPKLTNVCTLNPDVQILKLTSDDYGNVIAYTVEEGFFTVTVIDSSTNSVTQSLQLTEFPANSPSWATYEGDDAIAVTLAHKLDTRQILLLTKNESGLYEIHWSLVIPSKDSRVLTYSDSSNAEYRYDYAPVMAWSGKYLAFGLSDEYQTGLDLAIYGENGLLYYGRYSTSLNIWPVQPDGDLPLTLEWE